MTARGKATTQKARADQPGGTSDVVTFRELGTTGLNIQYGIVDEEFLPALKGLTNRVEVFRQMSKNDAMVGAVLFAIKMLIRGVEWVVKPATEEPADLPAAEHVKSCLYDMRETWDEFVDGALSFLVYGFSPHELTYKRRVGKKAKGSDASKHDDGLIGWRGLPVRAQGTISRWKYDDRGDLEYLTQVAAPNYTEVVIPESKLLIFQAGAEKGNPEGESILRTAYIPWYYKSRIQKVEGIGIERDLAGLPYAYVPQDYITDSKYAAVFLEIQRLLRNIRNDEKSAAIFPQAWDKDGHELFKFGLMNSGGKRNFDTNAIIQRYNQEIAMSVLADFLLVGHGQTGSWSLHSDKTKMFATAIGAFLGTIKETMNSVAVPRLVDLNPFDTSRGYPTMGHGDIEAIDLETVTAFITALSGAGMPLFPDRGLEQWARTRGGMPEIEEEAAGRQEPDIEE